MLFLGDMVNDSVSYEGSKRLKTQEDTDAAFLADSSCFFNEMFRIKSEIYSRVRFDLGKHFDFVMLAS